MNKTIIININGIVFHIEEDAYEILQNYMTDVKRHFSNSADSLEITTDIENRIAEMLSEILTRDNRQVIVDADVKTVVEQMGTVADFEHADENSNAESNPFNYKAATRRLFRDPDDHLLGGVCAGIANYFDIDTVWIRLAFAIAVAAGGTGLLLYIILWIVVPKAATRSDRMAMKGEKQNLQGFKKNFEDEMSSVKQNLSQFSHEARPFVYKARDFAGDFFHHLGMFIRGAAKVFVKIIGVMILLACLAASIALIVVLIIFVGFGADKHPNFFPFEIVNSAHATNFYFCAFVTAFIPVISIMLITLKGIFNVGNIGKSTGTVLLVVWLCSLGMVIFYGVRVAEGFRESATVTQTIDLKPTKNNTYYLKLNDIKYFTHDDSLKLHIKDHFKNMIVTDDGYDDFNNGPRTVTIKVEKGDVKYPVLEESYSAKGGNYEDALANAGNTSYVFAQQDSVLKFDYTLRKRPNLSWHDESIYLTLKVPLNTKVVVDQKLDRYVDGINLYDCRVSNKQENASSSIFIMTDNGLQCKVDTLVTAKKDSLKKGTTLTAQ